MHLDIPTAEVFEPLLGDARYLAAHGGRGSAKSHFFAGTVVERHMMKPGCRGVCVREVQKSLKDSAYQLIRDKIQAHDLGGYFDPRTDRIVAPGGGMILFQGMQDHTAETIKSLEGMDYAWVEEAQTLTKRSWEMLRPTIRGEGSTIMASWNPRHATDPVDQFFRGEEVHPDAVVVQSNWSDNPWFTKELEAERAFDERVYPDRYPHVWGGHYEPQAAGAIWTRQIIHESRVFDTPDLERIVVGVDPAVTNPEDNPDDPGTHGIVAVGRGTDKQGYVLGDYSIQGNPGQWATRAWAAYDDNEADALVVEVNQGGDMVKHTLLAHRPSGGRVIEVRATRGKHVRAEPIAALYTLGKMHHHGSYPELEQQMCLMTSHGWSGPKEQSPDRVDAFVWAATELFPGIALRRNKPTKKVHRRPIVKSGWLGA